MNNQRGFSLVELIVAMTVTLIVSSAIYGLLTTGGNAFRREPEVADRQQNIRAAMDFVTRDVFAAGAALPPFTQVFTRIDPAGPCAGGLNSCGITGTMGATAAAARFDDEDTDVIEVVSTDEQCPHASVCSTAVLAGSAGLFVTREMQAACVGVPGLVTLVSSPTNPANLGFTVQAVTAAAGTTACPGGGASPPNANLTLGGALAPFTGPVFAGDAVFLYRARLARYRVALNPDPLDPVPCLWRTETGRYAADGSAAIEPGEAGFVAAGSPWQLIARGIEDMQIEYLDGNGVWSNQPPVVIANTWTTLVRQVRITMSARATAPNLQGESVAGGGAPNAVRGQLSTVVTPRPTFNELQMGSQIR